MYMYIHVPTPFASKHFLVQRTICVSFLTHVCIGADTTTFTEDRLYDVLVCFVNSPFSFYVQIRDDEQVSHSTQPPGLPL